MRGWTWILIVLLPYCGHSQLPQYHARIFDARHGLNATQINDIFKDREDFLWIVYPELIEKFDGRTVQKFNFDETIVHTTNEVNNTIWAITPTSVYRLKDGYAHFDKVAFDTNNGQRPMRIFQLPGRPVYVLSNRAVHQWNESQSRFEKLDIPHRSPSGRRGSTFFDTCQQTIFFAGNTGYLYAQNLETNHIDSLRTIDLYSVYALTPNLAIYASYKGYAYWCDFKNGKLIPLEASKYFPGQPINHFRINGLVQTGKNKFMVLTIAGLMEYDLAKDTFRYLGIYEEGKPFEFETAMTGLLLDKNGTAWAHSVTMVASFSSINTVLGLMRNNESDPLKKWNNTVAGLAQGNNYDLWMATGRGFAKLDMKTGKVTVHLPVENAEDRLSHESIRGILYDGKYVILAPTNKGIWLYDPKTNKYKRPYYDADSVKYLSEQDFYDMCYSARNGDHIFPGRDKLYVLDGKTYKLRIVELGMYINTNAASQDYKGRIWIGASNGLICLDENYNILFRDMKSLPGIAHIFDNKNDELIIGTVAGAFRVKHDGTKLTQTQLLNTPFLKNPVGVIFKDSLQRFWFSTNTGLFLSDPDITVFRIFDYADNIQSSQFWGNSYIRTSNGMVFLGGRHGLNYFFPEKYSLDDYHLNVFVRNIIINSSDTIFAGHFPENGLRYNQNRLSFELTAPYYNNAEKIQYRYLMKGLSDEWVFNGNNNILHFSSLPPGNYQLKIAASTNGKHWYESTNEVSFTIRPPLWRRGWFIAFSFVLIGGALIFLQHTRESMIRKKDEEKLLQEQLKAENLQYKLEANQAQLAVLENERKAATAKLQSMRLQMNPHFLFNALNSIQQMIMTGNEKNATLYLSKFSKLLRLVLTHSDREVVSLREETEMLKLYIELEALRFEDTFTYAIRVPEDIDKDDNKVPTLLIQPFVENAIWHGLLYKEGPRKLDISFDLNENEDLVCTVEDNGIGREAAKAFAKKSGQNGNHTGKGVSVADERLKIFNEHNGDSSKLEITDVLDKKGVVSGTRVTIVLPNIP